MALSEELTWRGLVHQTTLKDISALDNTKFTFYWGVDPSADSMTVGHLAIALLVRRFIEAGHKAVLLVGGATGMIGDPDGKKQERDLLSPDQLETNKKGLAAQYQRLFAGQAFELVDNYDWFKDMGYLDFLRDVGKHTSLTQMLDRDFVQSRIGKGGSGISYAEFSYSLIQGYDFLHLHRKHEVQMQLCGADQWGNSVTGVDLIRKIDQAEAHVFSAPLIINKSTGVKFGKTEAGAVWLDETKTSVFNFYQFWLNTDDESVIDFLKIYTLLAKIEINALTQATKEHPETRQAQKKLADAVTSLVHGQERTKRVARLSNVLFGNEDFSSLSKEDVAELAKEIPTSQSSNLGEALVKSGLASSNSDARRLLESGAISVNGSKVTNEATVLSSVSTVHGYVLIKRGKNVFALVTLE